MPGRRGDCRSRVVQIEQIAHGRSDRRGDVDQPVAADDHQARPDRRVLDPSDEHGRGIVRQELRGVDEIEQETCKDVNLPKNALATSTSHSVTASYRMEADA